MISAKATKSENMTEGGKIDVSGARALLKSVINQVRQLPSAIHKTMAIVGTIKPRNRGHGAF
jgi:hypothetical protein